MLNRFNPNTNIGRLTPNMTDISMYFFAGYINHQTNMILSMTQAMKTLLIRRLINFGINGYLLLSTWVYLLLSNKNYNELHFFCNQININDINELNLILNDRNDIDFIPALLAYYCYELFNGVANPGIINVAPGGAPPNNIDLTSELKQFTGIDYTNRYEMLIYAMTKYNEQMSQKPILNHVIDTIFIIRKTYSEKRSRHNTIIDNYIASLDLGVMPNEGSPDNNFQTFFNDKISPTTGQSLRGVISERAEFRGAKSFLKLNDEILPSRKMIYIWTNEAPTSNVSKYYLRKFYESNLLGLGFINCFPQLNQYREVVIGPGNNRQIQEDTTIPNKQIRIQNYPTSEIKNIAGGDNIEFYYLGFVSANIITANASLGRVDIERSFYFHASDFDIFKRPSSKKGLRRVYELCQEKINDIFLLLIGKNTKTKYDFIRNIKSITKLDSKDNGARNIFKIFSRIYPILLNLSKIKDEIPTTKRIKLNDTINNLVNSLNIINSNFIINYYLFTDGDNISIPSFYYYKIPRPGSQEKSLIFEAQEDLKLKSSYNATPGARPDFNLDNESTALRDKADSGAPSKYTDDESSKVFNKFYLDAILNGKKFITTNTIKQFVKLSKNSALPPSIEGNYYEFYKYAVLDYITNFVPNNAGYPTPLETLINNLNESFNINQNDREITYLFQQAKLIEGVYSKYLLWFIQNTVWGLLVRRSGLTDGTTQIPRPPYLFEEFTTSLDNEPSRLPNLRQVLNKNTLNYYRINEKLKEDSFIIFQMIIQLILYQKNFIDMF